jgi:hypothetical protein
MEDEVQNKSVAMHPVKVGNPLSSIKTILNKTKKKMAKPASRKENERTLNGRNSRKMSLNGRRYKSKNLHSSSLAKAKPKEEFLKPYDYNMLEV